jgi:hypothetical protein
VKGFGHGRNRRTRNHFGMRLSRIQRFGSKRATISVDVYDLANSEAVLACNNS